MVLLEVKRSTPADNVIIDCILGPDTFRYTIDLTSGKSIL